MFKAMFFSAVVLIIFAIFPDMAEAARMGSRGPGGGDPAANAAFISIVVVVGVVYTFIHKMRKSIPNKEGEIQKEEKEEIQEEHQYIGIFRPEDLQTFPEMTLDSIAVIPHRGGYTIAIEATDHWDAPMKATFSESNRNTYSKAACETLAQKIEKKAKITTSCWTFSVPS